MSVPIPLRVDFDASRGLAKKTKDGPQARRLLALAAIYDGATRSEAAKIGGVGLQIIRDWVMRFNARGPDGLLDGKSPGQPSKLNDVQRRAVARMIESGPINLSYLSVVGRYWAEGARGPRRSRLRVAARGWRRCALVRRARLTITDLGGRRSPARSSACGGHRRVFRGRWLQHTAAGTPPRQRGSYAGATTGPMACSAGCHPS
jgi:transposase